MAYSNNDTEFINIDTLPSLFQKKVIASNFYEYLVKQEYFAFDVISLTNNEFDQLVSLKPQYSFAN